MSGFALERGFGVPTELVTPELFSNLLDSTASRWCVEKVRQIKDNPDRPEWIGKDYEEWLRRQPLDVRNKLKGLPAREQALAWADGMKKSLPGIIFTAYFEEGWTKERKRNGKTVPAKYGRYRGKERCTLTGLVCMDADHCVTSHNADDVRAYWQQLTAGRDLHEMGILLAYISVSGDGLKIVFKARMEWGNLIDNQLMMARELGIKIDEVCKDASRNQFLTTREDILYMNEKELFTYENKAYSEKYTKEYRLGHTQPTQPPPILPAGEEPTGETSAAISSPSGRPGGAWKGYPIQRLIDKLYEGQLPCKADSNRHNESLKLANDLLVMLDGDKEKVESILRQQPWVREIVEERNEDVRQTVESAADNVAAREKKTLTLYPSKRMQAAIEAVTGNTYRAMMTGANKEDGKVERGDELPVKEWGAQIRELGKNFPCMEEIGDKLSDEALPAVLFAAAAMMGTLMTRTWYHFYHKPNKERRLNYAVYVIGDPGSGKSAISDLYDVLMAPINDADAVGYDTMNNYKQQLKERESSTKEQKKEALKQPVVIIRNHPARTANGVFIEDMCNAVELVGQKMMHLHMFTFDSELDNQTKLGGSGGSGNSWIDKVVMELKAFHNEQDGQAYKNRESKMGMFNVYWNYVYTGTILSLKRKITESNFGSGLSTRLALLPMPDDWEMIQMEAPTEEDPATETLRDWAYKLDKVSGELPLWPLVKECWEWTRDHMELAKINEDKADKMLIKRVAYYGIAVSAPFILMRHWREWEEKKTFDIDDTDLELCRLALNIQYRTQHYYFGEYAVNFFANQDSDPARERKRTKKTHAAYNMLPGEFTIEDVMKAFERSKDTSKVILCRLAKDGYISVAKDGKKAIYTKLKESI